MRVLLFSDLHAHSFKPYSTVLPNGVNSRLQDAVNIIEQIRAVAESNPIDVILFGGDLFHVRRVINVQTFNLMFEAIARLRVKCKNIGLLVGNHDQTDRAGEVHSIFAFGSMVTVMERTGWHSFVSNQGERLNVLAVPHYHSKQDAVEKINHSVSIVPTDGPSMMLGHFGISGALVGSNFVLVDKELMELEDIKTDRFDQVFLGHYHETQQLAPNVRYIGASMQHNWGDSGQERGFLVWDTETNKVDFIPFIYPQFVKMTFDELQHLPNVKVRGDFIRVMCPPSGRPTGEEKIKDDLVNQLGARSVEFIEETGESTSLATGAYQPGMDMEDMIKEFVLTHDDEFLDQDMLIEAGLGLYRAASSEEKQ